MSVPFYNTPERIAALRTAAERWKDTPFAPAAAVCGPRGGACCHRLVIAPLVETDFPITQAEIPDGVLNRASHYAGSQMADWLRAHPDRFEEILLPTLACVQPGDILIIRLGIGAHHAALALDRGEVLQTWQGLGASITTMADRRIEKRLFAVFRPLEMLP